MSDEKDVPIVGVPVIEEKEQVCEVVTEPSGDHSHVVEAREQFRPDDLSGGLHNIKPPDDWIPPEETRVDDIPRFIAIDDPKRKSYRTDTINVQLTPEECAMVSEIIRKAHETGMTLDYIEDKFGTDVVFDHQRRIGLLRDTFQADIKNYVMEAPFGSFLGRWAKSIGISDKTEV